MLTLDLNLASRPFKNDTLPWIGLSLAVIALTLVTVWNVRTYRQNTKWVEDLNQQYSTTQDELTQFDRRERGAQREIDGYDLEALHVRADKANEVILWKAFSWTKLFNLLQEVLPHDVQMISIRPIFRPQGVDRSRDDELAGQVPVSVEGVAKTIEAFFSFERALLAHPNFARVEPEGHTQSRTGSLAFELKFLYDPGVEPPPPEEPGPAVGEESAAAAGAEEGSDAEEVAGADEAEMEGEEPLQPEGQDEFSAEAAEQDLGPEPGAPPAEEASAEDASTPAPDAEAKQKRPKPPGSRRRGSRRTAGGNDQEGGL